MNTGLFQLDSTNLEVSGTTSGRTARSESSGISPGGGSCSESVSKVSDSYVPITDVDVPEEHIDTHTYTRVADCTATIVDLQDSSKTPETPETFETPDTYSAVPKIFRQLPSPHIRSSRERGHTIITEQYPAPDSTCPELVTLVARFVAAERAR